MTSTRKALIAAMASIALTVVHVGAVRSRTASTSTSCCTGLAEAGPFFGCFDSDASRCMPISENHSQSGRICWAENLSCGWTEDLSCPINTPAP